MAFAKFKLGTSTEYTQNSAQYSEYIYACEDTRDVYIFGVKQPGFTDEQFEDLANINQTILEVIDSQKNIANGIAGLDEDGKIPVSLLNGQFARVQGIDKVATSSTLPDTTSLAAEYMVWCTDDKKLREWSGAEWDVIDPTGDTIYNFRNSDATGDTGRTNILYRWDGSTMVEISASLALGETTGTAYEGSKGKALADAVATNPTTIITGFGTVTQEATQVTIAFTDADKNSGNNKYAAGDGGKITIPVVQAGKAGLMPGEMMSAIQNIGTVTHLNHSTGDNAFTRDSDGVYLNYKCQSILNSSSTYVGKNPIPVATTTLPGIMSAADKAALDKLGGTGEGSLTKIQEELEALDAAAVKKVKCNTGIEVTPIDGLVTLPAASAAADGIMLAADKAKVNKIITNGDGTKFLANNGTYKEVPLQLSDDYAASELVNEALAPVGGDSFETAIGKLHKAIRDNEEVTVGALVNFQTVLGTQNPNQVLPDLSSTNYLQSASTFVACLQALDAALKTVADQAAKITDLTSRVAALEEALTLKTT